MAVAGNDRFHQGGALWALSGNALTRATAFLSDMAKPNLHLHRISEMFEIPVATIAAGSACSNYHKVGRGTAKMRIRTHQHAVFWSNVSPRSCDVRPAAKRVPRHVVAVQNSNFERGVTLRNPRRFPRIPMQRPSARRRLSNAPKRRRETRRTWGEVGDVKLRSARTSEILTEHCACAVSRPHPLNPPSRPRARRLRAHPPGPGRPASPSATAPSSAGWKRSERVARTRSFRRRL